MQNEQGGILEWVENGKLVQKRFAAIAVQYSNGIIGSPQPFHGRLIVGMGKTEQPYIVFIPPQELSKRGEFGKRRWLYLPRHIATQRAGLVAWAILLIAALWRALSHLLG
jgi:hypothetical protein